MSNDPKREDSENPDTEQHFESPAEAIAALVEYDLDELDDALQAVEEIVRGEEGTSFGVEFAFRVITPTDDNEVYDYYQLEKGEGIQYDCDLTGSWVALPFGAPIPTLLVYTAEEDGVWNEYKIHPDFLKDKSRLLTPLVQELRLELDNALFELRRVLSMLQFLSDNDEIPNLPPEGVSYPQGEGYVALSDDRPVPPEGEESELL